MLDAGTGTGEVVKLLLERANPGEVVAVDQSKGMLRQARKKIKDRRVCFDIADSRGLLYPDRRFDVVVCAWTLETLAQPEIAVVEFLRVTKEERPYHDCAHSGLTTFAHGLATVVVLRKCCTVTAPVLPCLEYTAAVP